MKKIIELIKKLLGSGSSAEKAIQLTQLETEVKKEVTEVKEEIKEVVEIVKKKVSKKPTTKKVDAPTKTTKATKKK